MCLKCSPPKSAACRSPTCRGCWPYRCHDVVRALEARGYIYEAAPRAGYYPTRRLLGICETISAHDSLVQRAEPLLQPERETGRDMTLAKATGMRISYLLVLRLTVGSEIRSMHATSAGKAFLSTLPEAGLEAFLKSAELKRLTPKSPARANCWPTSGGRATWMVPQPEESLEGVITISCPFTWSMGVYIVTVAGPPARMEKKLLERAVKLLDADLPGAERYAHLSGGLKPSARHRGGSLSLGPLRKGERKSPAA
jgi:IclR family acetate operon transcriptional repressor